MKDGHAYMHIWRKGSGFGSFFSFFLALWRLSFGFEQGCMACTERSQKGCVVVGIHMGREGLKSRAAQRAASEQEHGRWDGLRVTVALVALEGNFFHSTKNWFVRRQRRMRSGASRRLKKCALDVGWVSLNEGWV